MRVFWGMETLRGSASLLSLLPCMVAFLVLSGTSHAFLDPVSQVSQTERNQFRLPSVGPLEDLVLDNWDGDKGLPTDLINDILSSRFGYLYLGTYAGLVRFDGIEFEVFDESDWEGLAGGVTAVVEDSAGVLWVGANGGGLNRYADGVWSKFGLDEGLVSVHINALFVDAGGNLWIGTKYGLSVLRAGASMIETAQVGQNDTVRAIEQDEAGRVWVGMRSKGLFCLAEDGSVLGHYPSIEELGDFQVLSMEASSDGSLWAGSTEGLLRYDGDQWEVYTSADGLPGEEVVALFEDEWNSLWMLTNGGVGRFYEGEFSPLPALANQIDLVGDLVLDREQSLWVGTWRGGLKRLRVGIFGVIDQLDGLLREAVNGVYEAPDGEIWIAGKSSLHVLDKEGKVRAIKPEVFESSDVRDCVVDHDGRLWVMTHDGVYCIDGSEVKHFTTDDGLSSNLARACLVDPNGTLWVATLNGLNTYRDGTWKIMRKDEHGFSHDSFLSITEGSDGRLWFTTDSGGVNIWDNGIVTVLKTEDGIPSDLAFRLTEDRDGNMWAATNSGLACVTPEGRILSLTGESGLVNPLILQVLFDDLDQAWLLTNHGIYLAQRSDLLDATERPVEQIPMRHLTRFDGFPDDGIAPGVSKSIVGSDGIVWLPTWSGLAYIDGASVPTNPVEPLVHVNRIESDDLVWDQPSLNGERIDLPPNPRKLRFDFSAMGMRSPKGIQVEVLLEGFDEEWAQVVGERSITYTNLDPGKYTFRLRAENEDGVPTRSQVEVVVQIEPALSERSGFWVFVGALTVLLAGMVVALRVRHIRVRNLQLEKLVKERTVELEDRAMQLRESHVDLQHSFEALKVVSDEKSEILGIASHDMKNPVWGILGLSQILNRRIKDLNGSPKDLEDSKRMVGSIHSAADHLNKIIDDLLDSAYVDSGKAPLHLGVYDLYLLSEEVVELNARQAEAKAIKLKIEGASKRMARVDAQRFRQVLDNLISNAIKYSAASTSVSVEVRGSEDSVHVQVRDEGPGFSDDDMTRLFKKFQKLSAKPTGGESSTGLGLSIAKRATEDMGGRIWAENNSGKGASFFLEFPRDSERTS